MNEQQRNMMDQFFMAWASLRREVGYHNNEFPAEVDRIIAENFDEVHALDMFSEHHPRIRRIFVERMAE
jgi:hypothetical protein